MTDTATQSPLSAWLSAYRTKLDAITTAVSALARHLSGPLPSPQSEAEMEQLLRWRTIEFDLAAEPVSPSGNERAAQRAGEKIRTELYVLLDAYKAVLQAIEFEAAHAGRTGTLGIVGPGCLPAETLRHELEDYILYFTNGPLALPPNHPLRAAIPESELPSDRRVSYGSAAVPTRRLRSARRQSSRRRLRHLPSAYPAHCLCR